MDAEEKVGCYTHLIWPWLAFEVRRNVLVAECVTNEMVMREIQLSWWVSMSDGCVFDWWSVKVEWRSKLKHFLQSKVVNFFPLSTRRSIWERNEGGPCSKRGRTRDMRVACRTKTKGLSGLASNKRIDSLFVWSIDSHIQKIDQHQIDVQSTVGGMSAFCRRWRTST